MVAGELLVLSAILRLKRRRQNRRQNDNASVLRMDARGGLSKKRSRAALAEERPRWSGVATGCQVESKVQGLKSKVNCRSTLDLGLWALDYSLTTVRGPD